jgi:putative ABC transport system permease protein
MNSGKRFLKRYLSLANKKRNISAPAFPLKLLKWLCKPGYHADIEGDLLELYDRRVTQFGERRAGMLLFKDVILLLRPGIIRTVEGDESLISYGMFRSYFKIGWRNLLRNKSYSFINISGLAIGMALGIVIGLWVFDELNFNKSFKNYDRLYKVYHNIIFDSDTFTDSGAPNGFGNELRNGFAGFENVAMASHQADLILQYEEVKFTKPGLFVESQFIEMFSLRLLSGAPDALKNMHSILLSKTLADVMLGDNPIGKMVKLDNRDNLIVTGVYEDFPVNSEFSEVQMLMTMDYYFTTSEKARRQMDSWEDIPFQCYVLLNDESSLLHTESKIKSLLFQKGSENMKSMKPEGFLFPMKKWHLYAEFKDGKNVGGRIQFVRMFGLTGVFVLILACINFMNLSTARSERRSKEVGIRKVMGSVRKQLVSQFLSESLMIVTFSFLLAIVMVVLWLPLFNELANKKITIPWNDFSFIFITLTFIVATSILAGSYPALYLSSFNPVKALKGTFKAGRAASVPRKVMVVFQFTISIILIIGTVVVFQQIQHAKDRPVGFDREGIMHIRVQTDDLSKANYNSLRHDLLSSGVVVNMAKSDFPITGGMWSDASLTWEGKDPDSQPLITINGCSHDFPKVNGFQFVEGRDFSREFSTDSSAVIVNELAARLLSSESVIGKKLRFGHGEEREIVGVIKDQIRWTPFSKQSPHIYFVNYVETGYLTIRIHPDAVVRDALDNIAAVIEKYDAAAPFEYTFLDDDYARLFSHEERISKLASVFAVLAILISCLGIFGLASFTASQRTKEIGIRKVLGATIYSVWKMLSRDFAWLVAIALLVAAPLAYYFSNEWLQQYEYRIGISWWVFAVTGVGALTITLLTVSYQSLKAAMMNPVKSLRSE